MWRTTYIDSVLTTISQPNKSLSRATYRTDISPTEHACVSSQNMPVGASFADFFSFWVPYNEDRMPHMYKIIQDKCPKLVPKEHCFNNNNPSVMPWIRHIKLFEPRARSKRSGARSGFSPNITSQSTLLLSYVHVQYNPNPDPRLDYQIRSRSPTHTHVCWLLWQRMYLKESSWQMPPAVSK